ncbi:MAG: GGDEF domain-containing protein [Lachnospiraceae bacterium]|nr:GGDEF domain-containing protein [Lachnospiraceae bacterium]
MKKTSAVSVKKLLKIVWVVYAFLSICSVLLVVNRLFTKDYASISKHLTLDDGWNITINNNSYQNVSLDHFSFDITNKGDEITLQTILPDSFCLTESVLRLPIKQAAVKIYVEDEPVYEYGHDRIAENKSVGSGFLLINFPNDYEGKMLTVHLTVSENNAFTKFDPIRIYEWQNIYKIIMTENRIPLFLGCFLAIFGLVICFITAVALLFSLKYIRILCISTFSVCMGLWTLCYYNIPIIFAIPLYSASLIEYVSLFLAPIPLVIYMREDVITLNNKFIRIIYRILLTAQIAATTITITLHSVDLVHCATTLKYMQGLIICHLIYFIIVELINLRKSRQLIHRFFLLGIIALSCCIAYDLIYYQVNRYYGRSITPVKGITSLGLIIFIFILLISFYIDLTQKMMHETERNFLIKSAYTDELTQIHNRRYCMEYMNQITETKKQHYTVFCFDLNNLKTTNDTYGHAKGDILIKSAASVIAETFEAHGIVARMGGDEFIAITETDDARQIASLLHDFQSNIDRKNRRTTDLNMSIAYGYASGSATETNIEKVYHLADSNMYENKQKSKAT